MKNKKKPLIQLILSLVILIVLLQSNRSGQTDPDTYRNLYQSRYSSFEKELKVLMNLKSGSAEDLRKELHACRLKMKSLDFWWRYSRPLEHKSINGPLPVEWETEVFEKYERPYKRIGSGMTLAEQALDEGDTSEFYRHLGNSLAVLKHLETDSLAIDLERPAEFYFANRLFLLNLSSIYSTGFECPDSSRVIPELKAMCRDVLEIYSAFNQTFPEQACGSEYMNRYKEMLIFLGKCGNHYSEFNHFLFIRDYLNPLYTINADIISGRLYRSRNLLNYSLNTRARNIFDKNIYNAQFAKGVFGRIEDPQLLKEIDELGHQLFFDPILSVNNERSCASCHIPGMFYTDTSRRTAEKLNHNGFLGRNTPSTINADLNHLLMADGRHLTLQEQALAVMSHPDEMGSDLKQIMKKIMSCDEYADKLKKLARLTPQAPEPAIDHVIAAITYHYASFSRFYSPFDNAINRKGELSAEATIGFNLFMSKAQCATCHFVPQFNGVKPPFIGSEFEVLGVPEDTGYRKLSADTGRSAVNPAQETYRAFRTGTLRNIAKTGPYMHNGVFRTLKEVVEFYNNGGGAGKGLSVPNQTLSSEKLGLTEFEIRCLIAFMESLNEEISIPSPPATLPVSGNKKLNNRKPGGIY